MSRISANSCGSDTPLDMRPIVISESRVLALENHPAIVDSVPVFPPNDFRRSARLIVIVIAKYE
jgi:hypothetical protein